MSELKHTPGPWEVYSGMAKIMGKPFRVVRMYDMKTVCARVNRYSDAYLIAAAPDLLDACRQFSRALESEDEYELGNAYQSAGLAIAKATGEES